jgi:NAD+ diphosphatase
MPAARPFTGMALDRASIERKDPDQVARLLQDPATRTLAAGHEGVLMSDGEAPSLVRTELAPGENHEPVLLGLDQGRALFAVDLDSLPLTAQTELANGGKVVPLRDAGTVLPHSEAGLAAYLAALLNWHRRHRFCANCGASTVLQEAGYSRRCPRCQTIHFPRTDPVVIMTVEHERRLLLGRRSGWPSGRLSVLAGFVSPGESAEEAVIREVREESGIVSRDPEFVTSQPWPFPSSLMLGFHAQSDGGEPSARDGELEEVHWFPLEAVRDAGRERNPDFKLPPSVSIARFLIDQWVALHDA